MHPILFELFGVKVGSYGLLVSLGFVAGLVLFHHLAPKGGMARESVPGFCLWMLFAGVVGSRIIYVLVDLRYYLAHPLEVFMIWRGGLVIYGGILFPILACYLYARSRKAAFLNLADLLFPCAMLGLAIGRLGCFLVGDCFGRRAPESLPWAVHFPFKKGSMIPVELIDIPLHPTQIYCSLNALFILFITLYILKRRRFHGQVFLGGLMLYAATRGWIEHYRGDDAARGILWSLSTSQWLSLVVFVLSLILYVRQKRRARAGVK